MTTASTTTETTIVVNITPQDIMALLLEKKAIPEDWTFMSIDVQGLGLAKGANITIKCSQVGHSIPPRP